VSNAAQKALDVEPDRRHRLGRILYCTDFSHNSEQARGYAISLAAEYGAELALFHVAEIPSDVSKAEAIVAARTQELDKLFSETERKNLTVRSAVRLGKPYEEIVRYANEAHANLIIMTARGGDAVDRAVFGSTTYRVIQLGPCPVLAIHT
jgi:nucleotide-binding universal stress UspA family protein